MTPLPLPASPYIWHLLPRLLEAIPVESRVDRAEHATRIAGLVLEALEHESRMSVERAERTLGGAARV